MLQGADMKSGQNFYIEPGLYFSVEIVPIAVAQTVIPTLFFCAVYVAQSMPILIRLIE